MEVGATIKNKMENFEQNYLITNQNIKEIKHHAVRENMRRKQLSIIIKSITTN